MGLFFYTGSACGVIQGEIYVLSYKYYKGGKPVFNHAGNNIAQAE